MTKKVPRDYTERSVDLCFRIDDYHADLKNYIRELRCGYLLSYVHDVTEAGIKRRQLRAAVCAGVLAYVRQAGYDDLSGITKLREDLREEILANLVSLASAEPIERYGAMFLVLEGVYSPKLRRLLTVGRVVEIACLLAAENSSLTRNRVIQSMETSVKEAGQRWGKLSPYSLDDGGIRTDWRGLDSAAHVAAAYHTLAAQLPIGNVLPLRPFRDIRERHDLLCDYAEVYQELLCGRKVQTDTGGEVQCTRLVDGPIWRIPPLSSGTVASLPLSTIKPYSQMRDRSPPSQNDESPSGRALTEKG